MREPILFKQVHLVGRPPGPYDVLVRDGKIERVNPTGALQVGLEVETVECIGAEGARLWLSPSLIDWHTHQGLNATASHRLNLSPAKSAIQALQMVSEALPDPTYDPARLVAVDMDSDWPDMEKLDRKALDAISPERPVYLIAHGYHSMVCNSAGLRFGGVEPEGHSGRLVEAKSWEMIKKFETAEEVMDRWIEEEAEKAASLGVTEIVDLEMDHNIELWQRRYRNGFRRLRVHIGFYEEQLNDPIKLGLKTGDDVPDTDGLVKVGPFKIITDGSLGSQTAYCHDPYPGSSSYGMMNYQPSTLADMIKRGTENGFKMAIHAIGDKANHLCLKTIAAGPKLLPDSTIEHAQLLDFADLPLFKELGLIASIQPCHLRDDAHLCHRFWPGREGRAYPFKTMVDAGIPLKFGSDAPVAKLQPWEALASATSREALNGETFVSEQCIDIKVAYASSTSNGKLSVEEGQVADLCLLERDPLTADALALKHMKVYGTMLAGEWTWRSGV